MIKKILSVLLAAATVMNTGSAEFLCETVNAATIYNIFTDDSLTEYHIATAEDLVNFNQSPLNFRDKFVYLDADIDMTNISWTVRDFEGYFDGQYHVISHLSIFTADSYYSGDTYSGFFKSLSGTVARLELEDISVKAYSATVCRSDDWAPDKDDYTVLCQENAGYAGGICAANYGSIYGCTVSGTFTVEWVDVNTDLIQDGYTKLYDDAHTGSICAYNEGQIMYCTGNEKLCAETEKPGRIAYCEPDYHWSRSEVDKIEIVKQNNLIIPNIKNIPADDFSNQKAEEFRITTADGLLAFAEACNKMSFYEKTVYLDADIDMTDIKYIAPKQFSGTFDGRYHVIKGISTNLGYGGDHWETQDSEDLARKGEEGYVGKIDLREGAFINENSGNICRLTLSGLQIAVTKGVYATQKYYEDNGYYADYAIISISPQIGGICGFNGGIISDCKASGTLTISSNNSPGTEARSSAVYDVFGNNLSEGPYQEQWEEIYGYEFPSDYPLDTEGDPDSQITTTITRATTTKVTTTMTTAATTAKPDQTPPSITLSQTENKPAYCKNYELKFRVKDGSGIQSVTLFYKQSSQSDYEKNNVAIKKGETDISNSIIIPALAMATDSLSYYAEAIDLAGNSSQTDIKTITMDVPTKDSDPPVIQDVHDYVINEHESCTISITAYDLPTPKSYASGVEQVILHTYSLYSGKELHAIPMTPVGNDTYEFFHEGGFMNFNIEAIDYAGNSAKSGSFGVGVITGLTEQPSYETTYTTATEPPESTATSEASSTSSSAVTTTTSAVNATSATTSTAPKTTAVSTTSQKTTMTTTSTEKTTTTATFTTTATSASGTIQLQRGDLNGDGNVSIADAVLLCRLVNETENTYLSADANPDIDSDGAVTIMDVTAILRMLKPLCIFADHVTVTAGQNVSVPIRICGDRETAGGQVYLKYSPYLTLTNFNGGDAYRSVSFYTGEPTNPFYFSWTTGDGNAQTAQDGAVIAYIEFSVNAYITEPTILEINFCGSEDELQKTLLTNEAGEEIKVNTSTCLITVLPNPNYSS